VVDPQLPLNPHDGGPSANGTETDRPSGPITGDEVVPSPLAKLTPRWSHPTGGRQSRRRSAAQVSPLT
jgi:hypothetical protein